MQKWTREEVARLHELKARGLDDEQVGEMLGRTTPAVGIKLRKLARGQIVRNVKAWSSQEIETLRNLRDKYRLGWDEIGKRLGRPSGTVYHKYKYLEVSAPSGIITARISIPAPTEHDWRKRQLLSHQTLTAALCGDPLPGYSALERRA